MEDGNVYTTASGKTIPHQNICRSLERIRDVGDLSRLLETLSRVQLCNGIQSLSNMSLIRHSRLSKDVCGTWRHTSCSIMIRSLICNPCQKLKKIINENKRREMNQTQKRNNYSQKNVSEVSKVLRKQFRSQKVAV